MGPRRGPDGAHFDGDEHCRLTILLYTSSDWQPQYGGELCMLDERAGVWWEVPPRADHVVIFRSDRVLHKVAPCLERPRLALTVFLSEGMTPEQAELSALLAALTSTV